MGTTFYKTGLFFPESVIWVGTTFYKTGLSPESVIRVLLSDMVRIIYHNYFVVFSLNTANITVTLFVHKIESIC